MRERLGRRDRGAAAVEFALLLPVLMLFIFGIIDFGRMVNAKITINEAAREGARAAAILGVPQGHDRIDDVVAGMDVGKSVTGCADPDDPNANATATVTHEFHYITPINVIAGLGETTLEATGVMPCLQ
jgi:Flp pilus assembly protein TadG